jgi:hypothetical protein
MARWPAVFAVSVVVLTLHTAPAAGAQEASSRTNIKGAIEDSMRLLMIEHAVRIGTQEKTRRMLGGPFFGDYHRSVRMPSQWGDTDSWLTNYVGHPGQGAASGLEDRTGSRVVRAMLRMFLNPSRATANVAGLRSPWHRISRPIARDRGPGASE